jgi:hypothetical protein
VGRRIGRSEVVAPRPIVRSAPPASPWGSTEQGWGGRSLAKATGIGVRAVSGVGVWLLVGALAQAG